MPKVPLGKVLIEHREPVGKADGDGLPLIGVDNKIGLHLSRQARLPDLSRYKLLKMGWFAYNPMRVNVGSIGHADSEHKIGIISPDYVVFSCSELIHPEYFFYFIKSNIGLREIEKNTGGSVRERLYFHKLSKIEIELPDYTEQKRIVKSLNKKRDLLTTLYHESQMIEKELQYLKNFILQIAVQGKLTKQNGTDEPAGELLKRIKAEKQRLMAAREFKRGQPLSVLSFEEVPYQLPKGWVWCRLGETIELISGQHIEAGDHNEKQIGVPYLTGPSDFGETNPIFTRWTNKPKVLALKNDILITVKGSGVGKLNVLHENNVAIGRQLMAVRTILIERSFIFLFLDSMFDQLQNQKSGIAIPGIGREDILDMAFPLPPLVEQQRIVVKVQQLMQILDRLERQLQQNQIQAQQLLQGVLREAFESASNSTAALLVRQRSKKYG